MKRLLKPTYISSLLSILGSLILWNCSSDTPYINSDITGLSFSRDTLRLDTLYAGESSSTRSMILYNRGKHTLHLQEVKLHYGASKGFRVNLDGRYGSHFRDISIAPQDSIFLFVEATLPSVAGEDQPTLIVDSLTFVQGSHKRSLRIEAWRQNIDSYGTLMVQQDTLISSVRPLYIRDSLVVLPNKTLRIAAGSRLILGQYAHISIYGKLEALGTPEKRILIEGYRRDWLTPQVSYTEVPGQWQYLYIAPNSHNNRMEYTTLRNGINGLIVQGEDSNAKQLLALGCILTNMKGHALSLSKTHTQWLNCELSNTGKETLQIEGGDNTIEYCTLVNYYLWEGISSATLYYNPLDPSSTLRVIASVVDGKRPSSLSSLGGGALELAIDTKADNIQLKDCYLRTNLKHLPQAFYQQCMEAKEDLSKVYHLLGRDPKEPERVHFRFSFVPLSSAPFVAKIEKPTVATDLYGQPRPPQVSIGAYEPIPQENTLSSL